jgi:hypothetical protein
LPGVHATAAAMEEEWERRREERPVRGGRERD